MRSAPPAAKAKARPRANQRRIRPDDTKKARKTPSFFSGIDWQRFRFRFAAGLFAFAWCVLWGRAFYVQLIMGSRLESMADRQHTYTELVEAKRGNIYDRNGQTLARSVECRSVYANPRDIQDPKATALALAPLINMKPETLEQQLVKDRSFIWLTRKIDDATALTIQKAGLQGIGLSREYERVYPYKHLAGQLLGFVGLDNTGLEGLERSFDNVLSGVAQRNVVQRDGSGRRYYSGGDLDTWGEDLHLTLDVQIQFIAEDVIAEAVEEAKARWGGVIIADVASGDILAWAQYPFFNPNNYRQSTPSQYRNRLAADALEPGSTLKPFLLAAALEEKIITETDVFFCENGVWKTNRTVIRDDGRSYGDLPVDKILTYSSNIGVAKVALEVGVPTYYEYLNKLGFGRRTGIGVGESKGIVRQPQAWNEVDLMSAAFGQSVSVTGIQMVQGYATLANRGMFKPLRLVQDQEGYMSSGADQRIFSTKTADSIMRMLIDVVDGDGTGKRARIPGLRVAGKTGTAQKANRDSRGGYGDGRMASFAGIVPAVNPRYVIYVMLDEPSTTTYGGVLAAPVFQKVASRAMAYGGYLPDVTFAKADAPASGGKGSAPASRTGSDKVEPGFMPDVQGKSLRRAMELLAQVHAVPEVRGDGVTIVRQEPKAGEPFDKNGTVQPCILWLSEEETSTARTPVGPQASAEGLSNADPVTRTNQGGRP